MGTLAATIPSTTASPVGVRRPVGAGRGLGGSTRFGRASRGRRSEENALGGGLLAEAPPVHSSAIVPQKWGSLEKPTYAHIVDVSDRGRRPPASESPPPRRAVALAGPVRRPGGRDQHHRPAR